MYFEGDSMIATYNHNGMRFSTYDADNDAADSINCANDYRGGWWYNGCHHVSYMK